MSRWNETILFVDGFAGPGEYAGGELGSPLIALKALEDHSYREEMKGDVKFIFIEQEDERASHLVDTIERQSISLSPGSDYQVVHSPFDEAISTALDRLANSGLSLPPSFVMIDPFGVKGVRMDTISRLLANARTEVYISFMFEPLNRHISNPNFAPHLDQLFGCTEWRPARDINSTEERKTFLFELFSSQLKQAGARYVVHFELYDGNRLVYAIFFGTNSQDGCNKMKQAIWKATEASPYRFHGATGQQSMLGNNFLDSIDLPRFAIELRCKFGDRDEVSIEEVIGFSKSDETIFHEGHLKQKTLGPMERKGELTVPSDTRNRKRTYPSGTKLNFRPL